MTKEVLLTLVANMLQISEGRVPLYVVNFHSAQIIENAKRKLSNARPKSGPSHSQSQITHDSRSDSDGHSLVVHDVSLDQHRLSWDSILPSREFVNHQKALPFQSLNVTSHRSNPDSPHYQKVSDLGTPYSSMRRHKQSLSQGALTFQNKDAVRSPTDTNSTFSTDTTCAPISMLSGAENLSKSESSAKDSEAAKHYIKNKVDCRANFSSRRMEKMPENLSQNQDARYAAASRDAIAINPDVNFPPTLSTLPVRSPQQATPISAFITSTQAPYLESAVQERHPEMSVAEGLEWKRRKESGEAVKELEKSLLELLAGRDHVCRCSGRSSTCH